MMPVFIPINVKTVGPTIFLFGFLNSLGQVFPTFLLEIELLFIPIEAFIPTSRIPPNPKKSSFFWGCN